MNRHILLFALLFFMIINASAKTTNGEEINTQSVAPTEHPVEYSILSQKNYNAFSFLRHYVKIIKKEMSGGTNKSSLSFIRSMMSRKKNKQKSRHKPVKSIFFGKYHTAVIKYPTTDFNGKPVECSALILWHNRKQIKEVLYANHGTRIGNLDAPTDGFSPEVFFSASGALIIMPDYIGAGITHDRSEPYLVARNCGDVAVDGYLAGLKYAKENIKNFSPDYNGYIIGYSQGGAVSLAALRSLQERSEQCQKTLNVKRCVCGDGPYDLGATFGNYLQQDSMLLPLVLPLTINGMMTGYPEEVKTLRYEECFSDSALSTGIPQIIHKNTGNALQLFGFNKKFQRARDVLSNKIMSMDTPEYRILYNLLERQNLCQGWKPKYPLLFIHDKGDTIVPIVNTEHAIEGLKNEYVMDPIILNEGNDHFGGMYYMIERVMAGELYK